MGLRIGGVPGFDDELEGGRGKKMILEKENENEKENEVGRVGDLAYFSFFRAAAAGVNWGSSFTAAS